jgi:hypothetical protein
MLQESWLLDSMQVSITYASELVRAAQCIQVMSFRCYPLCFQIDVSIFYMRLLFLSRSSEQLLTEFVFPRGCICLFMLENAFIFHM